MNSKRAEQAPRTRVTPRGAAATTAPPCLRLLSYNIQAGLATRGYRDYVTGAWRYVLPTHERSANLRHIARTVRDYDFVAIQEADAGSLRTQQRNLVEWLARVADFPHHGFAVTRDMGPLAQICLGFLSRVPVERYSHYALPGPIPGRGALEVDIRPEGLGTLTVVVTQMALGGGARALQLRYLATRLRGRRAVVVGDFNERRDGLQRNRALRSAGLTPLPQPPATYPSWRPRLSLDQVLVMPGLQVVSAHAVPVTLSDHLPLAVEVTATP